MKDHQYGLSPEQIQQYESTGYVAPIPIFDEQEATSLLAELEEIEKAWPESLSTSGRNNAHYVIPLLDSISHNSKIVAAVASLIGSDVLIAGTTLFIKEPENEGFISWHQDARYIGLEPHDWVTAWIALSDVNEDNGCMRMLPGTHKQPLIEHVDTFDEKNMLTRGQTVPNVNENESLPVCLKPGEMSLHHPRVVHGSGPNLSGKRRVGFAIQSYIATHVEQTLGTIYVQQACGVDTYGHHQHRDRVSQLMLDNDVAFRDQANRELAEIFYSGAEKRGVY